MSLAGTLLRAAAVGLAARAIVKLTSRPRPRPATIRNAGPAEMRDPPTDWDAVDERDDESFPASDPPGGY